MPNFELLFPSKYFKSDSLLGKPDIVLTIQRVEGGHELTMAGGKKDFKPVLYFEETMKREREAPDGHKGAYMMVLNKTNARIIAKLYGGDYLKDWPGNKIALYRLEDTGNGKPGIRIRAQRPAGQQQGQQQRRPDPRPEPPGDETGIDADREAHMAENEAHGISDEDNPYTKHDPQTGEVFDAPEDATYQEIFDALEACNDVEILSNVWAEQAPTIKALPDVMQARLRVVFSSRSSIIENRSS